MKAQRDRGRGRSSSHVCGPFVLLSLPWLLPSDMIRSLSPRFFFLFPKLLVFFVFSSPVQSE